jgi:3-oxoacyl-[acyl-carrier-protein] synthase II
MFMMFNRFESLAPDFVRPFDRERKGLMLAEGAAALVVEDHRQALARGAPIYGEILGWGELSDAYHMTAPHPEGVGAVRSMVQALATARVEPRQVSYISAHGTGTPLNDAAEARALVEVFGPGGGEVPVSSLKSMLGHAQGAASALEAVSCLLALRDGCIPPNCNYETPDPECPLAVVAGRAVERPVKVALSNAFGFGGNISCVVFGRFEEGEG